MAAQDMNAIVRVKDKNGNVNTIYPATKIGNIEGLQTELNSKANASDVTSGLACKVDKETGKVLSTNDYTTAEKNKLAGIAAGATANIGTVTQVKVGSTAYNPSSGVVSLPAYPTTLPASDVSSWAKAANKPSYTYSEVGAAPSSHTHNYAGSSSAGGAANNVVIPRVSKNCNDTLPGTNKVKFEEFANDSTNIPTNAWYHIITMEGTDGNYATQLALGMTTNRIFYRNNDAQTWSAWKELTNNIGTVTTVKVGSTSYSPSSGVVSLPAYPTTLPASDVYSWAKASSKPSYSASEVGAIATSAKGAASGVASLDSSGKVPASQLPTASTSAAGIAKLYDGFDSESTTMGATAHAIRILKDTIYAGVHIVAHSATEGAGASISYTMNRNDFDPITGESSSGNRATGVYLLVCTNWATEPRVYIGLIAFSAADTGNAQVFPILAGYTPNISIASGVINVSSASKISLYSIY